MDLFYDELSASIESIRTKLREAEERQSLGEEFVPVREEELKQAETLAWQLLNDSRADPAKRELHIQVMGMRDELKMLREKKSRFDLVLSAKRKKSKRVGPSSQDIEQARLDSATEMLLDSRRTLNETEGVAASVASDLNAQRNVIASSSEKLFATGTLLGAAHRTMKRMQQREIQNRVCAYVAVGIVIFFFSFTVFRHLIGIGGGGSHPAPPPPTSPPTVSPTTATTPSPSLTLSPSSMR